MPTALPVIKCQYSRCRYSSTEKERIKDHNAAEHFECPFCGPIGELYSWSGYNAHLISSHNTYDFGVIPQRGEMVIPQKGTTRRKKPCRFAPRCPYTGPTIDVKRHSRRLHMECPVNGCDAFLSRKLFLKHVKESHRVQFDVQCPRDACSSRDISLGGYWYHALRHLDTGSEEHISHPKMSRCTFAPRCPYTGLKTKVERHSGRVHMECPINGCDAFLSKQLFFQHTKETHRDQFGVQCARDACSSRDISLIEYWQHALSHVDRGGEEDILLHPGIGRCTFAPRCPYKAERRNIKRHSLHLHIECPVNGCDAFLTKPAFMRHVRDKHSDQFSVQCSQDGCSTTSVLLVDYWVHGLSHVNTGSEERVLHTGMGRCTFAPRCPYTSRKDQVKRHSHCLHMECPVNGCDAFLSRKLFFKHIKKTHRDQFGVQCPRDGCSSRDISLSGYWQHAKGHVDTGSEENIRDICEEVEPETPGEPPLSLDELSHVDTGSEEHISHSAMGRCTFAPRCPHIGERRNIKRHTLCLHMECPVNGCYAFLSRTLFFKHIKETHRDQFDVQCPRDACSSRDISLGRYWHHAQSHINKGDEENIQDTCAEVEPEAGEPPLSVDEFLAMNESGAQGMEQEGCLEPALSWDELLVTIESDDQGMEQEGWLNVTKWNDDWDILGQGGAEG